MLDYIYRHKVMLLLLSVVALFAWGHSAIKISGPNVRIFSTDNSNRSNFSWGTSLAGVGPAKPETRTPGDFSSVDSSGSFDITWSPSDKPSIAVEAPANLLPHIKTEAVGGTLRIYSDTSLDSSVHVTLHGKDLQKVSISGSGSFKAEKVSGPSLDVAISGAADISLAGQVQDLKVDVAGTGDLTAGDLKANSVKLQISGGADATVNASESLDVSIAGTGDVKYRGSPKEVTKDISGVGSIEAE